MPELPDKDDSPLKKYAAYSGAGISLVAIMLAYVFLGLKLDEWLQTEKPWFTAGLSLLGAVSVTAYIVYKFK